MDSWFTTQLARTARNWDENTIWKSIDIAEAGGQDDLVEILMAELESREN